MNMLNKADTKIPAANAPLISRIVARKSTFFLAQKNFFSTRQNELFL